MRQLIGVLGLIFVLLGCKKQETPTDESLTEIKAKTEFERDALTQNLFSFDGNIVSFGNVLDESKGKPILIDVWASWCPDCIEGMPKLHHLQEKFPQLTYIFLSYDKSEAAWKNGILKHKVTGEHYLIQSDWKTGEFRKAIDLDWIPRYILVDKNGKIMHYRAIEADEPELIAKIKELTK